MRQGTAHALPLHYDRRVVALGAPVEVRRHPAARRLTLRVSHTRRAVIVTMPAGVKLEEAGNFLARHIDWVKARLEAVPSARPFAHGGLLPLRGEMHRIRFVGLSARRVAGSLKRRRDVVWTEPAAAAGLPPSICVSGDAEHAPRRLQDWLVAQARKDLGQRVAHHARSLGLRPKRISVRDQTSRWGSCSSTGLLCFSWRLILAPREVLDYVAAHEVAHLKEMNHSSRFWALVRRTMPDMDGAKAWLNAQGRELHSYGRSSA
jgi:hypothetical protein